MTAVATTLPAEVAKLRTALLQDQAPLAKERTPIFDPAIVQGYAGKPHSSRHLTLSQMHEMREDAILMFARLVEMVPIITGKWSIECADARKAAFLDHALRQIYGRMTIQFFMAGDFGWQALVKNFGLTVPGWRYLNKDAKDGPRNELVWDQGGIPALIWEPFTPLKPESVEPAWTEKGDFDGIKLRGNGFSLPGLTTITEVINGTQTQREKVDVQHSLWVVNQRDFVFGSIWGRSQFRSAFKYWYAYEMALAILNRSVERKGDPVVVVRFPKGSSTYKGREVDNQVIAFDIGRQARSGSVLTIPSEGHEEDEGGKGVPKWAVEYLTGEEKFDKLESILAYLDTQKLRSMNLPEQAVTEGRGGTSSRNVAKVMGTRSAEMQVTTQVEHDDIVNRYMLPQLAQAHYPILSDAPARKVTQSFGDDEAALLRQLLESRANSSSGQLPVDWVKAMEILNLPVLEGDALDNFYQAQEKLAARAEAAKPPPQEAKPNGPAGVTETGFYYDARERYEFADDADLLASLPPTKHYQDPAILASARLMRKLWHALLSEVYESFAEHLDSDDIKLEEIIELAKSDDEDERNQKIVDAIMKGWNFTSKTYADTVARTATLLSDVFSRAGTIELKRASLSADGWKPGEKDLAKWVKANAARMVRRVDATTQRQLSSFLLKQVKLNQNAPKIATEIRKHFSDFPDWRADLIAREETRRFYNAATLFAAKANKRNVQALDARLGADRSDHDCIKRNGRLFDPDAAFLEDDQEHPRGTLAWRIMPGNTELSIVSIEASEAGDRAAWVDREDGKIYLRDDLSLADQGDYLVQAGEWLERVSPYSAIAA